MTDIDGEAEDAAAPVADLTTGSSSATANTNVSSAEEPSNPPPPPIVVTPNESPASNESPAPVEAAPTWKDAFIDPSFIQYLEEDILNFLTIIDIPNTGDRSAAIIALHLKEEDLRLRFTSASALIHLQMEYARGINNEALYDQAVVLHAKCSAFKKWLTM